MLNVGLLTLEWTNVEAGLEAGHVKYSVRTSRYAGLFSAFRCLLVKRRFLGKDM